jgi:hypothetical protein
VYAINSNLGSNFALNPAPACICRVARVGRFSRFIRIFPLLCAIILSFTFDAFPRVFSDPVSPISVDSISTAPSVIVPYVSDIKSVNQSSGVHQRPEDGSKMLFGEFTVHNPSLVPFILQLLFTNSGELSNVDPRVRGGASIGLRDIELRYRDLDGVVVTKVLSEEIFRSDGSYYEVKFWLEDVQELYEVEFWGGLDAAAMRGAAGGVYSESVRFSAELIGLPVVLEEPGEPEEAEAEARLRRSRAVQAGSTKGMFRRAPAPQRRDLSRPNNQCRIF